MNKSDRDQSAPVAIPASRALHPAWIALIRHCREMGHGEIERLKIQDGVPVMAERSIQRILMFARKELSFCGYSRCRSYLQDS